MNRKKLFIINVVFSLLLQLITLISGFILPKIMLSFYGSEINGLVTSINQFINYCSLIEMGLTGSAVAVLYKPLAEDNFDEVNKIVSTSKVYYIKVGFIFSLLVVILSIIYPLFVKSDTLKYYEILFLVLILGASGCFEFFGMAKYRVLLTADQKSYIINIATCVSTIINVIVIFLFCKLGLSVIFVRLIAISSIVSRLVILYLYCKIRYRNVKFNSTTDKKLLSSRWDVLLSQISDSLQKSAPIIIITFVLSLSDVSVFSVYNIVIAGVISVLYGLTSTCYPLFGNVIAKKEEHTLVKAFDVYEYGYLIICTLIYIVTAFQINSFVQLYTKGVDDANYMLGYVGVFFAFYGLSYGIRTPFYTLILANNNFREMRYYNIIQTVLSIVLGVVFTVLWGILGVLIAFITGNVLYFVFSFIVVKKNFRYLHLSYSLLKYVSVVIAFIISIFFRFLYKETVASIPEWIFDSFLLTCIFLGIIFVVFSSINFRSFYNTCHYIKNMLSRKEKV